MEALDRDALDAPKLILALTVKGKGVSFMESSSAWHGRVPSPEEMVRAEEEIGVHIRGDAAAAAPRPSWIPAAPERKS